MVVRENRPHQTRNLPETMLHAAWLKAGAQSAIVNSRDGHTYRIIYAGRPADGAGPDFRDAILLRDDGVRIHGDVEAHVRSGDWHSHGHGTDRSYNGVVLHVALEDTGAPVRTMSGLRIPLLLLKRRLVENGTKNDPGLETHPRAATAPLPLLDMAIAGDQWFRNRSHGNLLHIKAKGQDQALWEGALECLGYPSNKKGFRQLAATLDWPTAMDAATSMQENDLSNLFTWAGGFGPKPSIGTLQIRIPVPEWSSRHGRPANHPRIRIRAAAIWAQRWQKTGGPAQTFENAVRRSKKPRELLSVFALNPEQGQNSPLGKARAADAVVNQLLPSVHALALLTGDRRLEKHVERLFASHPPLQPNSITREASRLLQARGVNATPRTAREQQGLIYIYRMTTAIQHPDRQLPLV